MRKFLGRFFVAIGVVTFLSVAVFGVVTLVMRKTVPGKTILEMNIDEQLLEAPSLSPLKGLMPGSHMTLRDVVDAIDRGARDERVVGLVAKLGLASLPMAQTQEIRDAVKRFRASKKFAVAYADSFGEFEAANGAYYLATAFENIFIQPSGDVGLTGVILEAPFVKGTLEKLGMSFRGGQRYEYKNALNAFNETKYTQPHKEAMMGIATSWFNQMKEGICEGRQISPEQFQTVVNQAPQVGAQAVTAKLVDGLAYRDEVYKKVKERAGVDSEFLYLDKYLERAGPAHKKGEKVALVFGVGGVARGQSDSDPFQASDIMGSDTVAAAIRAAVDDTKVKAIVFRVDSPGGSYVGSDTIWREVVRAREAKKPVIVSMGNLAASGGYFVAMAADKIVAQPGTITGSIGVFGGKFLTRAFWEKLGITWDEVHQGDNATLFTGTQDFTPAQLAQLEGWLDRVYVDFTNKVAEGRKLPKEKVLQIARGRIWSGQDAKNLGLVDELGGYETALKLAKKSAGIPESDDVEIQVFPKPKGIIEQLLDMQEPDNSDKEGVGFAFAKMLIALQPLMRHLEILGVTSRMGETGERDDVLRVGVPRQAH